MVSSWHLFLAVRVLATTLLVLANGQLHSVHPDVGLRLPSSLVPLRKSSLSLTFPNAASRPYARYLATIPADLRELTLCYWIKTHNSTSKTVFSYAVPKRPNEIWSGLHTQEAVFLNREIKSVSNNGVLGRVPKVLPGVWYHMCTTWSSFEGRWEMFVQGKAIRGAQATGLALHTPVEAGGIILLGQDQDVFGGKFDDSKAFRGEVTQVQLWDYVLGSEEVARLFNCTLNMEGNVLAWSRAQLVIFNGVEVGQAYVPCTN